MTRWTRLRARLREAVVVLVALGSWLGGLESELDLTSCHIQSTINPLNWDNVSAQ